jgi:CRP-like cAMP-binding protein
MAMDLLLPVLRDHGIEPLAAAALAAAATPHRVYRAGEQLLAEGASPAGLLVLVDGVLKCCRTLPVGTAQTIALVTPGEVFGAQSLILGREPAAVVALTTCHGALIPAGRVKALIHDDPRISEVISREMAREAAILQEWLLGLGRRSASSRIAHLICELVVRTSRHGHGETHHFPLTQVELADAVGLSVVHVNRVLQTLRADGLIRLSRARLQIGDWNRLAEVAGFDPAYLRLPTSSLGDVHAALLLPSNDTRKVVGRRERS